MPDSPEYAPSPESTPTEKFWDLESDVWDNEKIADFAGTLSSVFLERFSELPEDERKKRIDEFTNAIKSSDQITEQIELSNDKDFIISLNKFEGLVEETAHDEFIRGYLWHDSKGRLTGPNTDVPIENPFIAGQPSLNISYHPNLETPIEEQLQRLKELQIAAVELNTNEDFYMEMGPRRTAYSDWYKRDVVNTSIAHFKPSNGERGRLYKGRGTVKIRTHIATQ